MERVSVIKGKKNSNIVIVAPHGADDTYTDVIAETIASGLGAHAVINRGFERAAAVDSLNDKANCNNLDHIMADEVVYEEFLQPIIKIRDRLFNNMYGYRLPAAVFLDEDEVEKTMMMFIIHGMAKGNPKFVLGFGKGNKRDSLTMSPWRAALLYDALGSGTYFGAAGGKYAGRTKSNLNQYFRQWDLDDNVESIQIEISADLRMEEDEARAVGINMAAAIQKAANAETYTPPHCSYNEL